MKEIINGNSNIGSIASINYGTIESSFSHDDISGLGGYEIGVIFLLY